MHGERVMVCSIGNWRHGTGYSLIGEPTSSPSRWPQRAFARTAEPPRRPRAQNFFMASHRDSTTRLDDD
jgi:hypothetical protein